MERPGNYNVDEHVIDLTRGGAATASSTSPAALGYRLVPGTKEVDDFGFYSHDSSFWILIELVMIVSQFTAVITFLCFTIREHPRAPMFVFAMVFAIGCVATLPRLCWRYTHRNGQGSDQESEHSRQSSSQNNPSESMSRFEKYIVPASPSFSLGNMCVNAVIMGKD